MASVHKRATAKRDLVAHYVYLAEQAGIETAERFLAGADKSFTDPSGNPQIGVALSLSAPELMGLRKWHVSGFEKFLIFYKPRSGGVSIAHIRNRNMRRDYYKAACRFSNWCQGRGLLHLAGVKPAPVGVRI